MRGTEIQSFQPVCKQILGASGDFQQVWPLGSTLHTDFIVVLSGPMTPLALVTMERDEVYSLSFSPWKPLISVSRPVSRPVSMVTHHVHLRPQASLEHQLGSGGGGSSISAKRVCLPGIPTFALPVSMPSPQETQNN